MNLEDILDELRLLRYKYPLLKKVTQPFVGGLGSSKHNNIIKDLRSGFAENGLKTLEHFDKVLVKYGYTYNINNHDLNEGIKVLGPEAFILNSLFFDSKKSYVVHMALNSWKERINQNSWSKKLLRTSPSLSFQFLKASCLLRRIKHLFLSQEERDRRKGNFPEFK